MRQQALAHVRVGAALSQLQQLTRDVIGVVRQGGRHRALLERRHRVAAPVDERHEPFGLIDAGNRALGQFCDAGVDVLLHLQCERIHGPQERHVGAHPAVVDHRVEQQHMPLVRRQRPQPRMVVSGAGGRDVGLAALHRQREVTLALGGVLVLVHAGQTQHCAPRGWVLAVRQIERRTTTAEFGRECGRERLSLGAVLLFNRNWSEAVLGDKNVREDQVLERPIVADKPVPGRIGEWRRHRIAKHPHLHLAVADGVAHDEHAGAWIGRVDVRPALFQITLRVGFDVPIDGRADTEVEEVIQRRPFGGHCDKSAISLDGPCRKRRSRRQCGGAVGDSAPGRERRHPFPGNLDCEVTPDEIAPELVGGVPSPW